MDAPLHSGPRGNERTSLDAATLASYLHPGTNGSSPYAWCCVLDTFICLLQGPYLYKAMDAVILPFR